MQQLKAIVESRAFERSVLILIIINAITLGLETSKSAMAAIGPFLTLVDSAVLTFFVA